jgi:hypothetical protein
MDMRDTRVGGGPIANRAGLVVEVIGPAAAGKTTLVRALSAQDARILVGVHVSTMRYVGGALRIARSWLPKSIAHPRRDGWFTWRETKSLVFLDVWYPSVQRARARNCSVTILDHGVLYRLARLQAFGPHLVQSESFERWWRASLDRWMKAIDVVVWLDGSDEVLLRRVESRGHQRLGSIRGDEAKREFLARYRRAFEGLFAQAESHRPKIVRIRSDEGSVDDIAARVLLVLRSHGVNGTAQDEMA